MTVLTLSMVPHHQQFPRPSTRAIRALTTMTKVLVQSGYTPHADHAEWSVDARLYQDRHWENGNPVGHGPVAAVCLRLHQPGPDTLWWTFEYPARTPDEWMPPKSATSTRRLAVLGDAMFPVHTQDLALLDHLLGRPT
ncbi:hypothetical protein KGD82_16115 [Nocardiopsis eucommiae]|uniref:Uncharacterized protein n=1 Tax=Nocardiopsis eucommiae TaxID=2831970 RepID=A0A975QJN2_9ACTN|nr:hypothetical protein KGD82_16115 [Nocardiopsis eucommiae]